MSFISRRCGIKRTAIRRKPRRNPVAHGDRAYLGWVKTLPCLVCDKSGREQQSVTDAHHYGPRGLGQKAPHRQAIPLCHIEHHQYGPNAVHTLGKRFADFHGIDVWAEIARLNAEYDTLVGCSSTTGADCANNVPISDQA